MTPTLTWVDFHQKIKSFQIKLGEISPIPFPEIDFPEETRLLWCVFVCFFCGKPGKPVNNPGESGESPEFADDGRPMAVFGRTSEVEMGTGDR